MIVFHNVPPGAEGRAFIKLLRKYLPDGSHIRARGCNKDRKALAEKLDRPYKAVKQDVPCEHADRLRVYVTSEAMPRWLKRKGHGKWWFSIDEAHKVRWFGPFKTREAATAARHVSKGRDK